MSYLGQLLILLLLLFFKSQLLSSLKLMHFALLKTTNLDCKIKKITYNVRFSSKCNTLFYKLYSFKNSAENRLQKD